MGFKIHLIKRIYRNFIGNLKVISDNINTKWSIENWDIGEPLWYKKNGSK